MPRTIRIGDWFIDYDVWNPIFRPSIGYTISRYFRFFVSIELIFISFSVWHDPDWWNWEEDEDFYA